MLSIFLAYIICVRLLNASNIVHKITNIYNRLLEINKLDRNKISSQMSMSITGFRTCKDFESKIYIITTQPNYKL